MYLDVLYSSEIVLAHLMQARFEVDAQEGRLTLDRNSVAVEVVSTAGQEREDDNTVTVGKVLSKKVATSSNGRRRVDVPDTTSTLCSTEVKAPTKGDQADEVNVEKRIIEGETVPGGAASNEVTATEERTACENSPLNTTEEASKIGNPGNHHHGDEVKLVCMADASQPSPLSSNGSVLGFATCKLPS